VPYIPFNLLRPSNANFVSGDSYQPLIGTLPSPAPLQRQVSRPLPVSLQSSRNTIIENNNKIAYLILCLQLYADLKKSLIRIGEAYHKDIQLLEGRFHESSLLKHINTPPYAFSRELMDEADYTLPEWSSITTIPERLLSIPEEQKIKIAELEKRIASAKNKNLEIDKSTKILEQMLACYNKLYYSFFPAASTGQQQQITQTPSMHNPHIYNTAHSIFRHDYANGVQAIQANRPIEAIVQSSITDTIRHYN
jgi:hypothetical protein